MANRGLAVWAFRMMAQGAVGVMRARQLMDDWNQEIDCAVWQAASEGLSVRESRRLFCRCAYAALRSMGFHRWKGTSYFVPRFQAFPKRIVDTGILD